MIKEFEYKGDWWLPENPQNRIKGTLKFSPNEGATLDLIGSFKDIKNFDKAIEPDIIVGETTNGKAVTLYKCFEIKSSMSLPGSTTSLIYANYVFVGVHFQKTEAILFKNMSVHYLHLDEWIHKSNFEIQHLDQEYAISIKYKLPQPIQIAGNEEYKVSINFKASMPAPNTTEITIKQKAEIKIETAREMSFEYFKMLIFRIQNFLSLGTMKAIYPTSIRGTSEESKTEVERKTYYNDIEVFFQLPEISETSKRIMGYEMLFTFSDLSDNIEVYLRNWLQKAMLLEPVFDLYFGTLYNKKMYLQHRFLSLIQALEAYHRRVFSGKYQSDEEYYKGLYAEFMKCIADIVDSNFKSSLEWRMKYLNEFSLRKRLAELSQQYSEVLNLKIRNIDKLIEDTINTRHFLTHYDLNLKNDSKSGEELYVLCEKLKFILEVCFLFELGLPNQKIQDLIERNENYKILARMPD